MVETNNPLLARAEYLAYSHDRLPSQLRPKAYSSLSEALGEVPPSPDEAEITERLAAYQALLDDVDITTPLALTESVAPGKLAAAAKRESEKHALRSYLLGVGPDVVASLGHKLRGVRWSAEGYAHQVSHHRGQLDELVTDLHEAAAALGDKLLADSEHAIEANAAEVGRYSNAVAKLTAVTRVSVRDRNRETRDRVAILVKPVYDEAQPLKVRNNSGGVEVLSDAETQQRHEEAKLLFALWKKGSGVALAAVALGILPSFEVSVADDWDEVARRYGKIVTSASREVEAQAESISYSSSMDDTVTPAPNWEH